jgi:hypothetical protein
MTKTRRNSWRGARKAHRTASHIGWAYRRDRKHGPKSVARYLAAAGITRGGLQKYRKTRKTPAKYLAKKRRHKARSFRGVLANRGSRRGRRRVGRYASFVRSFAARHRGLSGPRLMKAAGAAWRGGARRNISITGPISTMNPRRKSRKGRRRRGSRSNPVLPYAAFNRPRRRKHRSNSGRRRYRRNPVLPYAAFNPAGGALASIKAGLKETISVDYWTSTVLPIGAGFLFSQFAGGMVYSLTQKIVGTQTGIAGSFQRIGSRALGAVAVSAAAMFLPSQKKGSMAAKVLAGGLVATLVSIVQEVFGMDTYSKITGMSDFGDMAADLTEELKAKIADSVRNEIARAEATAPGGVSAFVSTQNLRTAPDLGPGPRIGEMGAFVDTQTLATAPVAQQSGPPVVADLSAFSDSFADMMLV